MNEKGILPIWFKVFFYIVSIAGLILFGYLSLESYRQEAWVGLGNSGAWFFISAWMFFGTSFTPHKKVQDTKEPYRLIPAQQSESGKSAIFFPKGQYVYLIQDISVTGFCKIGKTNLPSKRLYDFGVHLPMKLSVIHIISCQNMTALETELHRQFKAKRVNGEWFALSQEDIEYIKSL